MVVLSKKYVKFIELVAEGLTQKEAYKLSVGKKGVRNEVAEVKGCQLAKKYATEIQQARQRHADMIMEAAKDRVITEALNQILTQAQVDDILCKIIAGELEIEKVIGVFEGKVLRANVKPNGLEILKAMDIYNKRFGSYAAQKINLAPDTELTITRKLIGRD